MRSVLSDPAALSFTLFRSMRRKSDGGCVPAPGTGILDIRIWNTDRHAGNILVRRPRAASIANLGALARLDSAQLELVPIDHGFCLPESLDPPYLEWLHWPAVRAPGKRAPTCAF